MPTYNNLYLKRNSIHYMFLEYFAVMFEKSDHYFSPSPWIMAAVQNGKNVYSQAAIRMIQLNRTNISTSRGICLCMLLVNHAKTTGPIELKLNMDIFRASN